MAGILRLKRFELVLIIILYETRGLHPLLATLRSRELAPLPGAQSSLPEPDDDPGGELGWLPGSAICDRIVD